MPDAGEGVDLKAIVRPIILAQGNKYIKELLRENNIKIGATKADFEENLFGAIDDGGLTQAMVEAWLLKVEGWGDQHVYMLSAPKAAFAALEAGIRKSPYAGLLDVPVGYDFPDELALTAVRLSHDALSIDWHKGSGAWERAKLKDYQQELEGDTYEFRAYRGRSDRTVVRFEWQFAKPYCGLFTQLPNDGETHPRALARVFEDLKALGVVEGPLAKVSLSQAVKAATQDAAVIAHSTKMLTEGGYVDLVATVDGGGIGDVAAIRRVRQGVDDKDFGTAEGVLSFTTEKHPGLSRTVKASIYGSDGRFRVWVQCKREDVYAVADLIWRRNG